MSHNQLQHLTNLSGNHKILGLYMLLFSALISGPCKCDDCDTEFKAKGNRWDHFIRLAAVYVLPAFIVLHLFGIGFALALNVILLPFALRVVGMERL